MAKRARKKKAPAKRESMRIVQSKDATALQFGEHQGQGPIQDAGARVVQLQIENQGSSGTEIFGGFLTEEYLGELQGSPAADLYDKMRRSDSKVRMVLNAVKNPIKSAVASIEKADEEKVPNAELHRDLIEHCLFKDLGKSWKNFMTEGTSCVDFGHAIHEIQHKIVKGHPVFGDYIGIRSLGFRSQRTINRWNIERGSGRLESVEQLSHGDHSQEAVQLMDAEHLLVFSLDKEGDNYEGMSMLRPAYGPWLRKQTFLKLMAIGTEKNAVPTVILKIPANATKDGEATAIEAVKRYVSHQCNYIALPDGWSVETTINRFDASKVQIAIDAENTEIVNAFSANFLLLGQGGGGGAYALSQDLSDFFLAGIEHVAEQIEEEVNRKLIPDLIQLNYGPQVDYPKLKLSGIADKAGEELAKVLALLAEKKIITADNKTEEWAREAFGLPKFEGEGVRDQEPETPSPLLSEGPKKKDQSVKLAEPKKQMDRGSKNLLPIMRRNLDAIGKDLSKQIVNNFKRLTNSRKLDAVKGLKFNGIRVYKLELNAENSRISLDALNQARREVPKAKDVKLAEENFDKLPPSLQKKVITQGTQLTDTQLDDLKKIVTFHYTNSVETIRDPVQLQKELDEQIEKFVAGSAVTVAAVNTSSTMVNSARNTFFFSPKVTDEIESMTFRNVSPVTDICTNLNGTTFLITDPGVQRYAPPLHHNALLNGSMIETDRGNKPIEKIQRGDRVLTHAGNWKEVYDVMDRFEDKDYFELELSCGKKVNITGEHPVLTGRGWLRVDQLQLTDDIITVENLENALAIAN